MLLQRSVQPKCALALQLQFLYSAKNLLYELDRIFTCDVMVMCVTEEEEARFPPPASKI